MRGQNRLHPTNSRLLCISCCCILYFYQHATYILVATEDFCPNKTANETNERTNKESTATMFHFIIPTVLYTIVNNTHTHIIVLLNRRLCILPPKLEDTKRSICCRSFRRINRCILGATHGFVDACWNFEIGGQPDTNQRSQKTG
jgi:hypothetical protein